MTRSKRNPRRRRKFSVLANSSHRRRRNRGRRHSNPFHARHRRRNPSLPVPVRELLPISLFAIGGGVLTRAIPEKFAPNMNTGIKGYALNAVTAAALGYGVGMISRVAGAGVLIGGVVMTGARIISDAMGQPIVTFADSLSASSGSLSGDPAFHLGSYAPSYFAVPGQSRAQGSNLLVSSNPNVAAAAPAAIVKTSKGQTAVVPLTKAPNAAAKSGVSGMGFSPRFKARFAS